MAYSPITAISFLVAFSAWSVPPVVASISQPYLAPVVTPASDRSSRPLQIAGHHDNSDVTYDDDGDQEESHHKHKNHHSSTEQREAERQSCGPYFKPSDLPYFRGYYSENDYANLPPGLRKHVEETGHLPPGLEKKYGRTGKLPPGLQKRFECGQPLPSEDSQYLYPVPDVAYERVGPLPPDSKLYLYGNDLILLNDHTKAIIDILRSVY